LLERIAPGTFARSLAHDRNRIRVLFQHGRDPSIGDKVLGTPPCYARTSSAPPTKYRCSTPATTATCSKGYAQEHTAPASASRCSAKTSTRSRHAPPTTRKRCPNARSAKQRSWSSDPSPSPPTKAQPQASAPSPTGGSSPHERTAYSCLGQLRRMTSAIRCATL